MEDPTMTPTITDAFDLPRPEDIRAMAFVVKLRESDPGSDEVQERFIAFTEVPGRSRVEMLYGWAGWTPTQRLKAMLRIDEELEAAAVALADRIGLLDSAWRLLPEAAREDAAAAARLKAELQAPVGPDGPSRELVEDWRQRFPPPNTRACRTKRVGPTRDDDEVEGATEETDES